MISSPISLLAEPAPKDAALAKEERLKDSAQRFEAAFIAAMLKAAGTDKAIVGDAGFAGEAVSGILIERYAESIAAKGGFNLRDKIFQAIARMDHE